MPSISPRLATDAPSVAVMNSGITGTSISVEMSVKNDTRPSATTLGWKPAQRRGTAPSVIRSPSSPAHPARRAPASPARVRDHEDLEIVVQEVRLQHPLRVRMVTAPIFSG